MVANNFNVPVEHIRFWVLVNRQNKTVRPDAPISDNYINTSELFKYSFPDSFIASLLRSITYLSFPIIFATIFQLAMEEIHAKMASRQNELKLYMEVAAEKSNSKVCLPLNIVKSQLFLANSVLSWFYSLSTNHIYPLIHLAF